jgi:hypothetical protein
VVGLVEVYYYIQAEYAENATDCGLKLADWCDREVIMDGDMKKCISSLLNPRDEYMKYNSRDYKCLKLQLMPKYCYIADRMLYRAGLSFNDIMGLYEKSVIPIQSYSFGQYRLPECLVTSTVIGEDIEILDKRFDTPILYRDSEELYMNNLIEGYKDLHEDFNDTLLYFFFSRLADDGKVRKTDDMKAGMAVFEDLRDGRVHTIKMPDIGKY